MLDAEKLNINMLPPDVTQYPQAFLLGTQIPAPYQDHPLRHIVVTIIKRMLRLLSHSLSLVLLQVWVRSAALEESSHTAEGMLETAMGEVILMQRIGGRDTNATIARNDSTVRAVYESTSILIRERNVSVLCLLQLSSAYYDLFLMTTLLAFQCPFKSCGRQFNVNSNMRRHYRNHLRAGFFPPEQYSATGTRRRRRNPLTMDVELPAGFTAMPSAQWSSSDDDLTESEFDMEVSLSDGDEEGDELEEDELDERFLNEKPASPTLSSSPSPSSSPSSSIQPIRSLHGILNHVDHSSAYTSPTSTSPCSPISSPSPSPLSSSPSPLTFHQAVRIPLSSMHLRNVS
jgi:hypothetical protein